MSLIRVSDLTFAYEGSCDNIFENVSFEIDTDWRLGFTGRNGRGKTTFLKLLTGRYEYRGKITASVEFEYFPYPVKERQRNTVDVAWEICPAMELWELNRELNRLGVEQEALWRPFSSLSNGEQTKVLLAVLFLKENSYLLIDEPTNHLDAGGRESVADYLNTKNGYLLVSHDRGFLDRCTDHTLSINKTDIEVVKGKFSVWWEEKSRRDRMELLQNEKLKKEVGRLSEAARRSKGWSDQAEKSKRGVRNSGLRPDRGFIGHKSAKMMKRSKCLEDRRREALEKKEELLKNLEEQEPLKLFPLRYRSEVLMRFSDVSIRYGKKRVLEHFNLEIRRGERIALCGRNGCGKTSLLKLAVGEELSHEGVLETGSGLVISYVPQDTSWMRGSLNRFIETAGIDGSLFKAVLRKLDLSRTQLEKPIEEYSDGQKKKVLLARSLCEKAHLYVWDEPMNFIDIVSRMQIEEALDQMELTALFVEHDLMFADAVGAKKISL